MRGKGFETMKKILDHPTPYGNWIAADLKTLKFTMGLLQIHQAMKVNEFEKFWNVEDARWNDEDLKIRQKILMTLKLQGDIVEEIRKTFNAQCPQWSKIVKD